MGSTIGCALYDTLDYGVTQSATILKWKQNCSFYNTMDTAKGRMYNAFKQALDDNPNLTGKVSMFIKISPNGEITSAEIISTTLNNPKLESKFLSIIQALEFTNGNFESYSGKYDFNFGQ